MTNAEIADEITREPLDNLIPYSNNPKEHPDEQIQKIASSIKNYGWDQPIVVDADNEVIKGHGRMQAADLLGLDEVPVIRREDLTDAEARASRIADNKTSESPWDDELLGLEVEQLEDDPVEIDSLGFDDGELDDVLGEVEVPEFDPVDEDEQADLDDTDNVECPECGHEWTPGF
jgi:ParB-like chromosome segregation protein Spo0J